MVSFSCAAEFVGIGGIADTEEPARPAGLPTAQYLFSEPSSLLRREFSGRCHAFGAGTSDGPPSTSAVKEDLLFSDAVAVPDFGYR